LEKLCDGNWKWRSKGRWYILLYFTYLGNTELVYSIEDVSNDQMIQVGDIVALPPGGQVKSVFFSEEGDPCIFDSEGVLLVLMHWRKAGQAKWIPLLDTKNISNARQTYWPISIVGDKFHCIILKVFSLNLE
jgi:chromosome transmission fidelity protein 4